MIGSDEPQTVDTTLSLEAQLQRLAETCRKPKPHQINLVGIWEETRDLDNKEVAKTIDEVYKNYFTHGIDRSRIYQLSKSRYVHPTNYLPENAKEIDKHFIKEAKLGHYIVDPNITIKCRVPVFLKPEGPQKFRLIPDYSSPKNGVSVNSLVPEEEGKVDLLDKVELIKFVYNQGKTTTLGKNDFKSWYRQIPMNIQDWPISVYPWRGYDWIDTRMPWGTRRASKIAHHFSIAITHIAYKYIPRSLTPCIFNYIDDHIFRADSIIKCLYVHVIYIFVCIKYSIYLNINETKLYAMKLVGLGILFDLIRQTAAVTQKRKQDIHDYLHNLRTRTISTAQFGQKCAGKCEDVAFLLYPLRVYLRHLRNAIPSYQNPNQQFVVNHDIKNACTNWIRALAYMKGRKLVDILNIPRFTLKPCFTDGSDVGFGVIYNTHWIYGPYHPMEVQKHNENNIVEREIYPILIACQQFGHYWTGQKIRIFIDNENAKLAIVNKDIRREKAHRLLIRIFELMMHFKFEIYAERIATEDNILADALSRLQIEKFKKICKDNHIPTDPAPMLFVRPPFEIGRIEITHKTMEKRAQKLGLIPYQ